MLLASNDRLTDENEMDDIDFINEDDYDLPSSMPCRSERSHSDSCRMVNSGPKLEIRICRIRVTSAAA
jgi:hypothetical protein